MTSLAKRVQQAGLEHPETFARVRAACGYAAAGISLSDHAALVTLDVVEARSRQRIPRRRKRLAA